MAVGAADRGVEALGTAADELRVPLEVVRRESSGEASDYGASLILVRPDHFVGWVGDGADDSLARDVIARSAGR